MNPFLFALLMAVALSGCSTSRRDAAALAQSRDVAVARSAQPMASQEADTQNNHLLSIARPQQSYPWHTPERVRDELRHAFAAATLIVEATVTNESARITSASGKWIDGWPEK